MARVLKMMHNAAQDKGNMVSIYRHAKIEDCIAQFDVDRANRNKQHQEIDEDTMKSVKPWLVTVFNPTQEICSVANPIIKLPHKR